jgi:DNA (cytosine-5)-methyltransferase 1
VNELALFAGAGGGILGGKLLGWRTVCAVECDVYAASVLIVRQNDGILEAFPVWDDVRTFDGKPWRGIIDVISGGFPCQDISVAGKGGGIDGERSGLWREFARIIGEVRPGYCFVENSPALVVRGGDRVLGDLAALGYDCRWGIVSAADAGAPHRRERIWIVADADGGIAGRTDSRREAWQRFAEHDARKVADADGEGLEGRNGGIVRECSGELFAGQGSASEMGDAAGFTWEECRELPLRPGEEQSGGAGGGVGSGWWESEPDVGRVAHGVAARVDKLRCLGNGQVPGVAALAWRILSP